MFYKEYVVSSKAEGSLCQLAGQLCNDLSTTLSTKCRQTSHHITIHTTTTDVLGHSDSLCKTIRTMQKDVKLSSPMLMEVGER